jgi:hypothetical protein
VAAWLRLLLDLSMPLSVVGVHLKVFAPASIGSHLDDLDGFNPVELEWKKEDLRLVLKERIRQASAKGSSAGRRSLSAVCDQNAQGCQVDERLVEMSCTPRDLVRLGNELFEAHVKRAPDEPGLSIQDIEKVLGRLSP